MSLNTGRCQRIPEVAAARGIHFHRVCVLRGPQEFRSVTIEKCASYTEVRLMHNVSGKGDRFQGSATYSPENTVLQYKCRTAHRRQEMMFPHCLKCSIRNWSLCLPYSFLYPRKCCSLSHLMNYRWHTS